MTNVNAFRPTLNVLEGRSLMSSSPVLIATDIPTPTTQSFTYDLLRLSKSFQAEPQSENPTAAGGGMGVGKVVFSDLSAAPTETTQTREHILLARQVGLATDEGATAGSHALYQDVTIPTNAVGFHRLFGDLDGAVPATGKQIEIHSWSMAVPVDPAAVQDYYLLLDGIKGESSDKK